jgi:hypothetical protein
VRRQTYLGNLMDPVLLGLAAPSAVGTAGSLLERTLHSVTEPFAVVLSAVSKALTVGDSPLPSAKMDDLHEILESLRNQLATGIESALAAAGVHITEPLELRICEADGQLEVVGDHPQKAIIESALADNKQLASSFTEVAALQAILTAADNHDEPDLAAVVALGESENQSTTALFLNNNDGPTLELILKSS